MNKLLSVFIAAFLILSSCNKDGEGNLAIQFNPKFENQAFDLNQVYLFNGDSIEFTVAQFYVSDVSTENKDGNESILLKDVALINFENETNDLVFTMPEGAYKNIHLGLGLNPVQNATDPSTYPEEHPMSLLASNYWMMSNSYIFLKIEGRHIENGVITPFAYHVGTDPFFRNYANTNRSYSINKDATTTLIADVNFADILFTLTLPEDNDTHTSNDLVLAAEVADNFLNSVNVY